MTENRKGCVQGTRKCTPENFAQTAECVVRHGHHSVDTLAKSVGMQKVALLRKTDGHSEDLTVRQVLALSELQRDWRMVTEIAREAHGVFVQLDARAVGDDDIRQSFLRAVQELGEDSAAITQALADGAVTADEAAHVAREIDETVAALLTVRGRVLAKAQAPVTLRKVTA